MSVIIVPSAATVIRPSDSPATAIDVGPRPMRIIYKDLKVDFGALGNGVHDDTLAIAAAIDELNTITGTWSDESGMAALLYVPPGIYLWDGDLDPFGAFSAVMGPSKGAATFRAAGANARLHMSSRGQAGVRGWSLMHLTVDGNHLTTGAPLQLGRSSECLVLDVQVVNSAADGLLIEETQNARFINLTSSTHAGAGVLLDYGAAGNTFFGTEINNCGTWGLTTGLHGYDDGTNEVGNNSFYGTIMEYSIVGSQGFIYLPQGSSTRFYGLHLADGSPLADMTFLKLRVGRPKVLPSPPGDPGLINKGITLGGHCIYHSGDGTKHTWLDIADGGVMVKLDGPQEFTGTFKQGIIWGTGLGKLIDAHGYMDDVQDGRWVTPLVDNSGTSTNLDAILRTNETRGRNMVIYHAGTRRTYEQWFRHGDAQPQLRMTTDGKLWFGAGGSTAPDATLYRDTATTAGLRADAYWHPGDLDTIRGTSAGVSTTSNLPAPSAIYRGYIVSVYGNGSTVADQQYVCRRLADGTYAWQALGTTSGTLEDAMSTMVRVPFGATDYVAEVNGSATATYTASGATNLDGSGTSLALSVPADPTRTGKHATVWVPFRGTAFGVRWHRDLSATDRPDLSVVVDGVAFALPTGAPRLTAEGLTGLVDEAEATVVTGLPDDQHLAQIVVPAQVVAQNITLLGLLLDARAGYEWGVAVG